MEKSLSSFDKRAKQIEMRHRKLASGYVTRVDKDGLIKHKPKSRLRFFRPKFILYPVMAVFLFKVLLLTQLGPAEYDLRLNSLRDGSTLDRWGAVVMDVDPVTDAVATFLRPPTPDPQVVASQ